MSLKLWSRLRLAPRIAILIVATLVAPEALDKLQYYVVRPPAVVFVERTWLVEEVARARQAALATAGETRVAALDSLPSAEWLSFSVAPERPAFGGERPRAPFDELQEMIAQGAGVLPRDVLVSIEDKVDLSFAVEPILVVLEETPSAITDFTVDGAPDNIIAGEMEMAVPLPAGEWLVMMPRRDGQEWLLELRNVLLPVGGILLISAVSIWLSRIMVRPLAEIAAAAERFGREREPTFLGSFGVPEYESIARSFNDMQRRLKGFVDERLQMMAAISHDLRTPLTRLRLYAEYIPDEEQKRQVLSDIGDLQAMVSSTLAFAENQLRLEPFSTVDLASMLISLCDTAADAGADVTFDGPDHLQLRCQPVAIRRAFANLIDNGCKYGGGVRVVLRRHPDHARVLIADRGPGIPEHLRELAFAPFQRLEQSRNRGTGGTGLGLTIARDVVAAHKGEITLAGGAPNGLEVAVCLPLAP